MDEVEGQIWLYDNAKHMSSLDIERNLNRDQTVEGDIGPVYMWHVDSSEFIKKTTCSRRMESS